MSFISIVSNFWGKVSRSTSISASTGSAPRKMSDVSQDFETRMEPVDRYVKNYFSPDRAPQPGATAPLSPIALGERCLSAPQPSFRLGARNPHAAQLLCATPSVSVDSSVNGEHSPRLAAEQGGLFTPRSVAFLSSEPAFCGLVQMQDTRLGMWLETPDEPSLQSSPRLPALFFGSGEPPAERLGSPVEIHRSPSPLDYTLRVGSLRADLTIHIPEGKRRKVEALDAFKAFEALYELGQREAKKEYDETILQARCALFPNYDDLTLEGHGRPLPFLEGSDY